MDFVADSIVKGRPYPALAQHQARPYTQAWREFGEHWPHTTPAELFAHMDDHGVEYTLNTQGGQYYTIGLGFFNFSIDYFALIQPNIMQGVAQGAITVLFYYHEGDNPHNIKARLDALCVQHNLPVDCYRFVSGNTTADEIPGFAYFPDHELLYWRRNHAVPAVQPHVEYRTHDFVVLSRTHKWWRATVMADMHQRGILKYSMWSYNTKLILGDSPEDNPIERLPGVDIPAFMRNGPYTCDVLSAADHNNHAMIESRHFTDAYFNIVLETHFDADGSGGAFLTEKTFKAIKHAQPFVIIGCAGSLATLRSLGYRTFDHAIDNSYDLETNNTQRWLKVRSAIQQIQHDNPHELYKDCWADIFHNQQLFLANKAQRLNTLFTKLQSYD
jgi:hypothetical protein